ncbi:threonine ammonia-lyase, biosynthetic [Actinomarinicola tropica]|uniref:L-threonine dehydratase n=1 Tax=Actinomarinicola tropica TaxID=2789776 RepID=A0A5Q2RH69_9ACTN|nr:threonine ammonia-lyase, biosynthetic [Actinomarinicola tropica]QGG93656.1 threonine ammonia-lyase, biosynthetic [Actinomarinicola tropica]
MPHHDDEPELDGILRAILTSRVYEVATDTPLDPAPRLSRRLGASVMFKREDLQPVFSFKLRGAHNKIAHLSPDERARGVITASAGNHAQGVAYSARHLGIPARIVMPETTPAIKVDAVRAFGAEVILWGDSYTDAQEHCDRLVAEAGMTFVHPFDDPLVVAGQGTIADEVVRHATSGLDAVFVPVGGGGLIGGIGAYLKAVVPEVKVIGVESIEADAMSRSLAADEPIELDEVGIFADGVAVRKVGRYTFPLVRRVVDEIVIVRNDEISAAIKDVFEDTRTIVEPAGALSVAGMKHWARTHDVADRQLVAVLSGANMNFDRLRFVAEQAELGENREALFAVTIPERPGAFRDFCATLGRRVITEFNYRLNSRDEANIFVGVAVASRADASELAGLLRDKGYDTIDLSDDDVATLHVRHMVGGRPPGVLDEVVFRFEFPERPGALMRFLETLGGRWNISLFHYRNHGADVGRVLAGFEVPPAEREEFRAFLDVLGYPAQDEVGNVAYEAFLTRAGLRRP